jgi:acetyltransferase-like isoleucine patch superfamily enzyme
MTVLPHDWYAVEVPASVVLGERSWLYSSFAFVHHRSAQDPSVRIGHDSGVYKDSYFDLGPQGEVEIGSYCAIAGATFSSNARIVIGDYALISYNVVIADSSWAVPPDAYPAAAAAPREPRNGITIGDDAWIGARAVILGGSTLGDGAIIGAGAIVDGDVPDYAIAAGNPARLIGRAPPRQENGPR